MSDDVVAIEKLSHPDGRVVYLPEGEASPDTAQTLERDGLVRYQYDEDGKYVSAFVLDPDNVRVICWQLTVNADARRRGLEDVFKNLPADLVENFPDSPE
jgi:hypothetical protein